MGSRKPAQLASRTLPLLALSLLAPGAFAGDWYVDAVNGNDSNSGTSPQAAWRTLSHAVTQVPAGSERFLVAPGVYNAPLGESFPIRPKPGHQVIGLPGATPPVFTAEGAPDSRLFRFESTAGAPQTFGPDTRLENLLLRRASYGIEILAEAGDVSPSFANLTLVRMSVHGVAVSANGGTSSPTIERTSISDTSALSTSWAIHCEGTSSPGVTLQLNACRISDSGGGGLRLSGNVDAQLERCHFDQLGLGSINGFALTDETLRVKCVDTASTNALHDVSLGNWGSGAVSGEFERCTFAGAGGLLAQNNSTGTLQMDFESSIVDIGGSFGVSLQGAQVTFVRCFVSDSSYDGLNGCFSDDPRYVDPVAGDFRLKYGSPCIDAAWTDAPVGTRDAAGNLRDTDGDLDRVGHTDIGAFEFRPLELDSTGKLGSPLRLRSWGAPGALSTIYWTRKPLGAPTSTPFGTFLLDPNLARVFRVTSTGYDAPTLLQRMIPGDPALVGQTFSFQALVDSPASPILKAFSNGVEVMVTP